jgi:hypothetical protein
MGLSMALSHALSVRSGMDIMESPFRGEAGRFKEGQGLALEPWRRLCS